MAQPSDLKPLVKGAGIGCYKVFTLLASSVGFNYTRRLGDDGKKLGGLVLGDRRIFRALQEPNHGRRYYHVFQLSRCTFLTLYITPRINSRRQALRLVVYPLSALSRARNITNILCLLHHSNFTTESKEVAKTGSRSSGSCSL